VLTDPPYYDAVPYAYLSDFFYVWLRRVLPSDWSALFAAEAVPKEAEIVVDRPHYLSKSNKNIEFYERELTKAFGDARRVVAPNGIGTIVFASKTTASWEAILKAVIDSGWIITGSWPIDTEREARMAAIGQARLASSVHIVCRPRENPDGTPLDSEVGEWRDVLAELPKRIHDWMPRLQGEGVVGADAVFACLGPALEIFSRYSRVERPNGDQVTLKEYLEYVWAAVSKEAISMIFEGADTTGFEEDARLTAMWLWTLNPGPSNSEAAEPSETEDGEDDSDEKPAKSAKPSGFTLEYDAARKIAQGLGAHLEQLVNLVEVKGETARLLPVAERTKALFGKEGTESPAAKRKKSAQLSLPGLLEELRGEVQEVFKQGLPLDRIYYPAKSSQIPNRPALALVVLPPEQEDTEEARTLQFVDSMTKQCGTSDRTFKSALIWCVPDTGKTLYEEARKLLAWEDIQDEAANLKLDETQRRQLTENLAKSRRDLREAVWRTYKTVMLLGKDNAIRSIDLGLVHSSAADSLVGFIVKASSRLLRWSFMPLAFPAARKARSVLMSLSSRIIT
jgi:hypothetical protein